MEYKKYKWFYTSSGKLVVAGKSAENNDKLLREILDSGEKYTVMHTSHPGSPFSIIIGKAGKKDMDECAIFTGCFSRAWKEGKKKTGVDIFKTDQLHKEKRMKTGTWGVFGKVEKKSVELKLILTKQKGVWRAVPENSADNEILKIQPGIVNKEKYVKVIMGEINKKSKMKIDKNQILAALPAGGVKVY